MQSPPTSSSSLGGSGALPPSGPPAGGSTSPSSTGGAGAGGAGNAGAAAVAERTGRVVRLHFCCHAELPVGSFLRVTGSTRWAPGTAACDPAEAAPAFDRTESMAFPVGGEDADVNAGGPHSGAGGGAGGVPPVAELYASSVEMVTTPDTYPLWKTRKPVVLVLNGGRNRAVQHHYYRYLVVCPGATLDSGELLIDPDDPSSALVSTSNELVGSTPVMEWEDPFGSLGDRSRRGEASNMSITSSICNAGNQVTRSDFRNLPYRTLDVDVRSGRPVLESDEQGGSGGGDAAAAAAALVRIDRWNVPDDVSFRPYRIREAVSADCVKENLARLLLAMIGNWLRGVRHPLRSFVSARSVLPRAPGVSWLTSFSFLL